MQTNLAKITKLRKANHRVVNGYAAESHRQRNSSKVNFSSGANEPSDLPLEFGRYQIRGTLGQGGMGSVYLAHDSQLDRLVALKIPVLPVNPDADAVADEIVGRSMMPASARIESMRCMSQRLPWLV
jgi:serine/threonine protein kinase